MPLWIAMTLLIFCTMGTIIFVGAYSKNKQEVFIVLSVLTSLLAFAQLVYITFAVLLIGKAR